MCVFMATPRLNRDALAPPASSSRLFNLKLFHQAACRRRITGDGDRQRNQYQPVAVSLCQPGRPRTSELMSRAPQLCI